MQSSLALIISKNPRLLRYARTLTAVLVVVAISILLTTTSLRFAINQPRLYEYGFDKYNISQRTGITEAELTRIARHIIDYFNSDEEHIYIRATIFGEETDLFKPREEDAREIDHMRDVKGLVQGVYMWQWITLGFVLAYGFAYWLWMRRGALPLLAKTLVWGGVFTIASIAIIGLASLVGFDAVFLKFHQIGFSNDFWQLDPQVHNLIAMFPQDFFLDATLFVALMTIAEALLLIAVGGGYLWWRHRGRERARRKAEEGASLVGSQASLP
ncbi:MAG: TIGR01906 family membrane protein [Dehalococcoidia bacterium]